VFLRHRNAPILVIDEIVNDHQFAGTPSLDEDYLVLSTIHSAKGQEWDAVHVLNVAVDGKHQRQGIGRRLMSHVVELGEQTEHQLVTLEVRASNDPAKLLYVTMGFAPVGVRRRYYRDNDEDAIVMVKRLGERKAT